MSTQPSIFTGNTTTINSGSYDKQGGGIANFGTLTITESTFEGNSSGYGGGVYTSGILTVINSTFSGNMVYSPAETFKGGGIGGSGTMMLINSTFVNNQAFCIDSYTFGCGYGGGVFICAEPSHMHCSYYIGASGTLTVINSTFSDNSSHLGGGIAVRGSGATASLYNTIIANSTGGGDCR
jgi:predicted outer membrane repeat protein